RTSTGRVRWPTDDVSKKTPVRPSPTDALNSPPPDSHLCAFAQAADRAPNSGGEKIRERRHTGAHPAEWACGTYTNRVTVEHPIAYPAHASAASDGEPKL